MNIHSPLEQRQAKSEKILVDAFLEMLDKKKSNSLDEGIASIQSIMKKNVNTLLNQSDLHNTKLRQIFLLKTILQWLYDNKKINDKQEACQKIQKLLPDFIESMSIGVLVSDSSILREAIRSSVVDLVTQMATIYELNESLHAQFKKDVLTGGCYDIDICAIETGHPEIIHAVNNLYRKIVIQDHAFSIISATTNQKINNIISEGKHTSAEVGYFQQILSTLNQLVEDKNTAKKIIQLKKQSKLIEEAILKNDERAFKKLIIKLQINDDIFFQPLLKKAIKKNAFGIVHLILLDLKKTDLQCLSTDELASVLKNLRLPFAMNEIIIDRVTTTDLINYNLIPSFLLKQTDNQPAISTLLLSKHGEAIFSQVSSANVDTLVSYLLVMGNCLNKSKQLVHTFNADLLKILLLASSYPQAPDLSREIKKCANQNITTEHIELAKRCNNKQIEICLKDRYKKFHISQVSDNDIEKIKLIQGGIRTRERITRLYYPMYNTVFNYNSLLHMKYVNADHFIKKTNKLFYVWMHQLLSSHCVTHSSSGLMISLLAPETSHYVSTQENFVSILENGYLYSQIARNEQMGITNGKSLLTENDKKLWDDKLVCTSPFTVENYATNYYVKINFDLRKLPLSYLKNAITKLGDFHVRLNCSDFYDNISITQDIKMSCRLQECNRVEYILSDGNTTITFSLPTLDEIFHGIKGLEATLSHLFYVLCHSAQQKNSEILIDKIIAYFTSLEKSGKLIDHLNGIITKLFTHMEIDFQHGLPLSFDCISLIQYSKNDSLELSTLKILLAEDNLNQLQTFFLRFPDLTQYPYCISELLRLTPAYNFAKMCKLIASLSPEAYLAYEFKIHENYKKTYIESRHIVNQLASQQTTLEFNLLTVLEEIKNELAKQTYSDFRKQLVNIFKTEIVDLCNTIKSIYKNVSFSGGDSKLRQVLTNLDVVNAMTGVNHFVLLAILACEMESQQTTYICTMVSQATGKKKIITLGQILFYGFEKPPEFFASIPINEKYQDNTQQSLQRYIQQKLFTTYSFKKWQDTCLLLYQKLKKQPKLDVELMAHLYPAKQQLDYASLFTNQRLSDICHDIRNSNFNSNPAIIDQVNEGMIIFLKEILPKHEINQSHRSIIIAPSITLHDLLERMLSSTAILKSWPIAHLLFDCLHFGVALTDKSVCRIQHLNDKSITFYDLVNSLIEYLQNNRGNEKYPLMYEQLSLRVAMLDEWRIKNNELTRESIQTNSLRLRPF